jgi:hypothetical protein
MNEHERLHRQEPERTGPIRDFTQLYRHANGAGGIDVSQTDSTPTQSRSAEDNTGGAAQTVKTAYRIIQKHVDEGRRAAAQSTQSSSDRGGVSDPLQQLLDRLMVLQGEFLPLLLDVMRDLIRNAGQFQQNAPTQHGPMNTQAAGEAGRNKGWIVDIDCRRPIEIAIAVRDEAVSLPLATPGLHALDGNKPALQEVSIVSATANDLVRLRIIIPKNQASGTYSGVVVSQQDGEVQGTISIKVKD